MALVAPQGGGNLPKRPKPPAMEAGTYPCRLAQIIDMGVQPQRPYQGEEKPPKPELMLTFEFVDSFLPVFDEKTDTWTEVEDEEKPRWLSTRIPMNSRDSDLAKSTKWYRIFDPTEQHGWDWSKLLGTPINVTITVSDKGSNYVSGISLMRAKEAASLIDLKNEPKILDQSSSDTTIFNSLPKWLQEVISEGLEFKGTPLQIALDGGPPEQTSPPATDDDVAW